MKEIKFEGEFDWERLPDNLEEGKHDLRDDSGSYCEIYVSSGGEVWKYSASSFWDEAFICRRGACADLAEIQEMVRVELKEAQLDHQLATPLDGDGFRNRR